MNYRPVHSLFRLTALLAVLGVLALTVLAVSPQLHAWVHGHSATAEVEGQVDDYHVPVGDPDHMCAVSLFTSGVTVLLVFCLLAMARLLARRAFVWAGETIPAAYPRYRLVPAHAPPAA